MLYMFCLTSTALVDLSSIQSIVQPSRLATKQKIVLPRQQFVTAVGTRQPGQCRRDEGKCGLSHKPRQSVLKDKRVTLGNNGFYTGHPRRPHTRQPRGRRRYTHHTRA